jgi:hypothetical protein
MAIPDPFRVPGDTKFPTTAVGGKGCGPVPSTIRYKPTIVDMIERV